MKKQQPSASSLSDICDRFSYLEELVNQHSHELQIQFERIAQIQAEFDKLGGQRDRGVRDVRETPAHTTDTSTAATTPDSQTNSSAVSADHQKDGS